MKGFFALLSLSFLTSACLMPDGTNGHILDGSKETTSEIPPYTSSDDPNPNPASSGTLTDKTWDFSTLTQFTYDATLVLIVGGTAKLIPIDQTDSDNTTAGFAGGSCVNCQWDAGNTWVEQTTNGTTGTFYSRVMDSYGTVNWTSLSWVTSYPLQKELPNSSVVETGYTASNAVMTNNVLLYHLNETAGSTTVDDTSATDTNTGTCTTCPTFGSGGKYNTAATFDGTNDYITVADAASLKPATISVESWVKPSAFQNYAHIVSKASSAMMNDGYGLGHFNGADDINFWVTDFATHKASGTLTLGTYSHVVGTYDGAQVCLYINGAQAQCTAWAGGITQSNNSMFIGMGAGGGGTQYLWQGEIDEVAVYGRVLSLAEITARYKRGLTRLKFQARSCTTSTCATESFIGPDGTASTYYTELLNTTSTVPTLALAGINANRYFQYKMLLESDSVSYTPEVESVTIGPVHYPASSPTVVSLYIATDTQPTYIKTDASTTFVETLGGANVGTVKYQVSKNGLNWYYYNGVTWVPATLSTHTNTAAEISAAISSFSSTVGKGVFYFKAYMISNMGTQQVELDQLEFLQFYQ